MGSALGSGGMKSKVDNPSKVGGSAPQNTAVGSGSRPGNSKMPIDTSQPEDARSLGGRDETPNKPL
jgi:hypothetical protein